MIATPYRQAVSTLYRVRYGILTAALVYTISGICGWVFADALGAFERAASSLVGTFANKSGADFVFTLFIHNLIATYIGMCLLTLWGLVPMVTAIANGLLLGWIVTVVSGPSPAETAMLLVPHGLFEWPAMLIAWGTGFWRGVGYRFEATGTSYLDRWVAANRVFFLIVLPLLFVAALIEGRAQLFPGLPL